MNANKEFRSGFAMPGMLLNMTLGGLVLVGAGSLSLSNAHKVAAMASFPGLNSQDQNATSLIAQDLRQASSIESATTDRIVLHSPGAGALRTVTYSYDPALRTLTRTDAEGSQTVLSALDNFSFSMFQRTGTAFNSFGPANAANANLVGCHWTCSRSFGGSKLDSEHVEMAPVALRNHR